MLHQQIIKYSCGSRNWNSKGKQLFIITIASLAVSLSWWSYRRSLSRKSIACV